MLVSHFPFICRQEANKHQFDSRRELVIESRFTPTRSYFSLLGLKMEPSQRVESEFEVNSFKTAC